jgi:hypothetical protein
MSNNIYLLQNKHNEEVNRTESFPSVSIPWPEPAKHIKWSNYILYT